MFAQFTPPSPTATAAIVTAAIAATAAIIKKLLPRKLPHDSAITRLEFHQAMDATRDRIDGHFIGLSEKIETLGTSIHERLNETEASLARLDERTKTL